MQLDYRVFEPQSLVDFLAPRLPRDSEPLTTLLTQGRIHINQHQAQCVRTSVYPSDTVWLDLPDHWEAEVDCNWRIVWQNHEFLVVDKPPGLPVSRTTRNLFYTLISLVRRQSPWHEAHLMHRLDAETSGLILLAKNSHVDKKWKKKASRLMAEKEYLAWVFGQPNWQHYDLKCTISERSDSAIRNRMYVCESDNPAYTKPQLSRTEFTLVKTQGEHSLIRCRLHSGRKHQIRCHLAHLGHPIVGDKIYAFDGEYYLKRLQQPLTIEDYQILGAEFQQLRAVRLGLQMYGKSVEMELPVES